MSMVTREVAYKIDEIEPEYLQVSSIDRKAALDTAIVDNNY